MASGEIYVLLLLLRWIEGFVNFSTIITIAHNETTFRFKYSINRVSLKIIYQKFKFYMCMKSPLSFKVGPDDATLLLGTRDSVPMVHCSTLSQGVASASNNVW